MNINLCIPTLCRYDLLADCISSALEGSLIPTQINVIDNGGKFVEHFGNIDKICGVPLDLYVPTKNIGVCSSFNHFLHKYDDYIIVSNDDVIFHKDTIRLLIEASKNNPKELFFTPNGYWEHWFSLYSIKKDALSIIGQFDSNFENYFEDADYNYRMKIKGYKPFVVDNCTYEHVDGGSATIRSGEPETKIVSERFNLMGEYYLRKWGGLRNNEQFTKPFNLL